MDGRLGPAPRPCGPRWAPWPVRTGPSRRRTSRWPCWPRATAAGPSVAWSTRSSPPCWAERTPRSGDGRELWVTPRLAGAGLRPRHGTVPVMDRRIFGLENEYGVTCTLRGQRRLSPDEVARYLFRRVVSWGRSSNVFLENGARLYLDVGQPSRVRHPRVRLHRRPGGPRQGGGADPRPPGRGGRGPPARGGHPGRHLPVQEQHRLGRQLLRLPRELPDQPARRLRPLHRGAHPVPGEPPDLRRGRQGAADGPGGGVLPEPAGRAHLGGRVVGHHPQPARSSTPATSPTPTPSGSAGCTSSWATPT